MTNKCIYCDPDFEEDFDLDNPINLEILDQQENESIFLIQMSGTSEEPKQPDSVGTTDDRKLAKVLADTLDGTPLLYACDKLWSEHGWCEEHCGQHQQEPDAECWMRYAEVMANE